ncbi:MAG: NAD-dependent epimerase/dehydratase family protein [Dehalococcoidia bacterium]
MKVLVTGGTGFVGSHVVDALIDAGHEPYVFDLRPPQRGAFVRGDLTRLDDLTAATAAMDAVCHLGAVGDVYLAFDNPPLAAMLNVVGTANVMQAALRNRLSKVVYASTWEVYGHPRYQPLDEQHPCTPDHPYNITKLAGEHLALSYDALKGVPTIALRLGTAYGPRMRPNSVFSLFIDRARQRQPITIQGTGGQSRQFTHARDIGRAFVPALETDAHGAVYNIVAQEVVSIRRLAEMVAAALPTEIVFAEARVGDVTPAVISSAKAQRELGWTSRVSFEEGLGELLHAHAGETPRVTHGAAI